MTTKQKADELAVSVADAICLKLYNDYAPEQRLYINSITRKAIAESLPLVLLLEAVEALKETVIDAEKAVNPESRMWEYAKAKKALSSLRDKGVE